ncbi:YtxH domain-containing protein [Spirosoma pomorum]
MPLQRRKYSQDYVPESPYLSGVLTGLVAGLAVGLLFAPRSGKEPRKQIAGTIGDQAKEAKHQWYKTKARDSEAVDTIKTNVGLVADNVEDEFNVYADKVVDQAKSAVDKFKDTGKLG